MNQLTKIAWKTAQFNIPDIQISVILFLGSRYFLNYLPGIQPSL